MSTSTSTSEAASVRRCRTARWGATQSRLWIWPLLCKSKKPKSTWFVFRKWVVLSHFLSLTVTPNRGRLLKPHTQFPVLVFVFLSTEIRNPEIGNPGNLRRKSRKPRKEIHSWKRSIRQSGNLKKKAMMVGRSPKNGSLH